MPDNCVVLLTASCLIGVLIVTGEMSLFQGSEHPAVQTESLILGWGVWMLSIQNSDAQFELEQVVLTTSTLAFIELLPCAISVKSRRPNKMASACMLALQRIKPIITDYVWI